MVVTHAGKEIRPEGPPLVVGVINLSPESFYKGSVVQITSTMADKIAVFAEYDVDCIDVGAMSTRPLDIYGGKRAELEEEKKRINDLLPHLMDVASSYDIPVALDTQYSAVAKVALPMGISVINDISGLKTDPELSGVIANHDCDLVIMATDTLPGDVCGIEETKTALSSSLTLADDAGIDRDRIVLDPGFGGWQGRNAECDFDLIRNFEKLKEFNLPLYIGVSRKSTIGHLGGGDSPDKRLAGSLELTSWLVDRGAAIIRTHDVMETRLMLNTKQAIHAL